MTIKFNWGTGIALVYAAFAVATASFVTFAMSRPVDLVSDDYYAQSLQMDRRIAAERNAAGLGRSVSLEQTAGRTVTLSLPAEQAGTAQGTVTLYRSADSRADRLLALAVDPRGQQGIALAGLAAGRWIVQVRWTAAGRDFYLEQPVFLQ